MKPLLASLILLAFLGVAGFAETAVDKQDFSTFERGRYLATVGDCAACHTMPGGPPYAGGFPVETPFGIVVGSNLTPDRETGIGSWTDDEFIDAMRSGIAPSGAHLYPAMPYPYYAKISRKDALAIRTYLDTLTPVRHRVVANQLPFPFDIRFDMRIWDAMYFSAERFKPVAGKSAEWNRGAYLVEGLGHCGACHTAKTFLGGDESGRALQGGLLQGWFAPDLTGTTYNGLARWSVDDVVAYLRDGHNRFSAAVGPMSEVVADSTSKMTDDDLRAIAVYLKSLRGPNTMPPGPLPAQNSVMRLGNAVYVDNCEACHAATGVGVPRLFSDLKGSSSVESIDPTNLIRIVLEGVRSVATDHDPTAPAMPAFGWKLSDRETAAVVTYIRNAWGNAAAPVSSDQVSQERQRLSQAGE